MVKFLTHRPIAVFTATLAFLFVGIVAMVKLPTSLMPDIPIPEITVHLSYPNNTARDIETNVTRLLRNQLLQVSNLKDIHSETRDGSATIKLYFDYGTNTDLAFIETNEKVDGSLNYLPKDLERPLVIKASATDIPVLNITLNHKTEVNENEFLELSEFAETVIKRRIEQLPDIALADISGLSEPEIWIKPNMTLLKSLNISIQDLIRVVQENNFELGNLIVKNGIYQYSFKFLNPLRTIHDVEQIQLKSGSKIMLLKDLAKIKLTPKQKRGQVLSNGEQAILISVIKQSNTKVEDLKRNLKKLLNSFENDYPEIEFHTNQDQTKLLQLSIRNLKSSLLVGSILAVCIMFFFLKDLKLPLIIAISIPSSLIISFLFLFLFGISINVISLSGLILGVGMMIDNAIIVIDNINQKLDEGKGYFNACIKGTNEMISPLISSILTTSMIFLPLLFLSGITGALFHDQAIAVSIGLIVSLLVSILLIPVVFLQLKKRESKLKKGFYFSFKTQNIENIYEKGFYFFSKRKYAIWGISILSFGTGCLLFTIMTYNKLPHFKENEMIFKVDWNENINIEENKTRIQALFNDESIETYIAQIGEQQFLLRHDQTKSFSETEVYMKSDSGASIQNIMKSLESKLQDYPFANFYFSSPKGVFEYIFGTEQTQLTAQVFHINSLQTPEIKMLNEIEELLPNNFLPIPKQETVSISILHEKLFLYEVNYSDLVNELKSAFDQNFIDDLKSFQQFIPIKLNYQEQSLEKTMDNLFVSNKNGRAIPIKNLIKIIPLQEYKTIYADKGGEYLKYDLGINDLSNKFLIDTISGKFKNNNTFGVRFSGSYFDFSQLGNELLLIVIVAVLLLYFIMAAQFESLKQPLIVLMELPIDVGGALLLLWLFGGSINVMAAIGLVVMSGIVINDSIIKIHTINTLRKQGLSLQDAVKQGGKMRLKPIIMTSLTTILALFPFLFIEGLGADLQKPLALTVIGGLILGTFISLYFIPFLYMAFEKK